MTSKNLNLDDWSNNEKNIKQWVRVLKKWEKIIKIEVRVEVDVERI